MPDEKTILSTSEILSQAPEAGEKTTFSTSEILGDDVSPSPVVPAIPDEHRGAFLKNFSDAVYDGFVKTGLRMGGEVQGLSGDIGNIVGFVTGLNSFKKYREAFVESGRGFREQARELTEPENVFERYAYYPFIDAVSTLPIQVPLDVMTGAALRTSLTGRILPQMEAVLGGLRDFTLGIGFRGMIQGIEGTEGGVVEKAVGGVVGAGEAAALGTLYTKAGNIGKMAAIGLAQTFYDAGKQGRIPSVEEMADGTMNAAMLGVIFTALPHIVEGSKIAQEKKVLRAYDKKIQDVLMPKDVKTYEIKGDPSNLHKITSDLLTDARIRPEIRESLARPFLDRLDQRGDIAPMDFKLGQWKDQSKLRMLRETMERIIETTAGPDAKAVQAETTEKIKENETYRKRWETDINRRIQGEEMVGRGIKPNSPDSALTMRYGEGRMTEAELQKASLKNWKNVKKAAAFSRRIYDETLDALNNVRERYGYEPIEKRVDYFRHFQEISVAAKLFGHFLGGEKLPTSIAGVINRTKYGKPFTSTELQRMGGEFKEDAVLALQNYVRSAGPQLFHLDSVQRIRTLERYIRGQALVNETALQEGRPYIKVDASNFVEKLTTYADMLAGQPSAITQAVNRNIDRPFVAGVRAIQRNVVLNMIGGNIAAAFMNLLPTAQQVATTNPKAVVKGMITSALHLQREVPFELGGVRSEFYDRRYPKGFLPSNWVEKVAEKGFIIPNVVDRFMVQSLIAGKYHEGIAQGLKPAEAMKAADNYAVRVVTDRTTGQIPSIMAEPDLQLINRFQVEINNLWSWLAHDVPKESQYKLAGTVGRMAVFAIASTLINNVYEKMIGRRPQLDFLEIIGTLAGINQEGRDRPFVERIGPAFKALAGNVPFGNMFVEGGRFPISAAFPDVGKMLGDPEHEMLSEFVKPLWYLLPFGGGGQVRKTWEGTQAWARGYVATPAGNIRYEVQKDFYNFVRGFLFGKNAFPEAVRYWNQPKSER